MSFKSAREISAQFTSGKTSAAETIETTLNRISELNPKVNAFTSVIANRARAKAKSIDAARAEGRELGRLRAYHSRSRICIDVEGLTTFAGSKINRNHPPAKRLAVDRTP